MTLRAGSLRPFDELVSLGRSCGVKYQIALNGFRRDQPGIMPAHFSSVRLTHKHLYPRGSSGQLFDWLVTPFSSVTRLIDSDFAQLFERRNLEITGDGNVVRDRVSGLLHYHEFRRTGIRLTAQDIDRQYPSQRARLMHYRDKFRSMLNGSARILYVALLAPDQRLIDVEPFHSVLNARHPRHRYMLLCVRQSPAAPLRPPRIERCGARQLICELTTDNRKPAIDEWQFDDGPWQALLDQFAWKPPIAAARRHGTRRSRSLEAR